MVLRTFAINSLGENGFVVEGVVAHARKIRGELAQLAQSGMGVRFLAVEELMQEVLPGGDGNRPTAVRPPAAAVFDETEEIPEPPTPPPVPVAPAAVAPPVRPAPPAAAMAAGPGVFIVRFATPQQFLEVFQSPAQSRDRSLQHFVRHRA